MSLVKETTYRSDFQLHVGNATNGNATIEPPAADDGFTAGEQCTTFEMDYYAIIM